MLYLLDANVLITAHNTYYPIERVPEFWDWLLHQATNGLIKMPFETLEEVKAGGRDGDPLAAWVTSSEVEELLLLDEDVVAGNVQRVVRDGYAPDLTDDEMEAIGHDPFLIAYCLNQVERTVVTVESSKPGRRRHKRHIPDVCASLDVRCCDPFSLYRVLNFHTRWRS